MNTFDLEYTTLFADFDVDNNMLLKRYSNKTAVVYDVGDHEVNARLDYSFSRNLMVGLNTRIHGVIIDNDYGITAYYPMNKHSLTLSNVYGRHYSMISPSGEYVIVIYSSMFRVIDPENLDTILVLDNFIYEINSIEWSNSGELVILGNTRYSTGSIYKHSVNGASSLIDVLSNRVKYASFRGDQVDLVITTGDYIGFTEYELTNWSIVFSHLVYKPVSMIYWIVRVGDKIVITYGYYRF